MNHPRIMHPATPQVLRYKTVPGIRGPVAVYAETCAVCGRKVRRMPGLGEFWHAGGGRKPR